MTAPLLAATGVSRTFGRARRRFAAVTDVSLTLAAGEIVGIVGPNGAGKTTLLRMLAGLLAPDRGAIRVGGAPPNSPAAHRLLGFAPDSLRTPALLTVRETLEYYATIHADRARRRALVEDALAVGGLGEMAHRRVAQVSAGWLRRLALAQAALGGRRVLLLDEPLAAVDPPTRRALCQRLAALAAEGTAILLSSHDLVAVERLAARVLVLAGGTIRWEGSTAETPSQRGLEDGRTLEEAVLAALDEGPHPR